MVISTFPCVLSAIGVSSCEVFVWSFAMLKLDCLSFSYKFVADLYILDLSPSVDIHILQIFDSSLSFLFSLSLFFFNILNFVLFL